MLRPHVDPDWRSHARPIPDSTPLTAEEIAALPEGTRLIVLWSGGNGPFEYRLAFWGDMPIAQTDWQAERDIKDIELELQRFIGPAKPYTRVWLSDGGATGAQPDPAEAPN